LDFSSFETKRKYIDTDLLSNRHKIVHGEKLIIDTKDFDETFKNIMSIIEKYKNIVLDAAFKKQYLKGLQTGDSRQIIRRLVKV